MTIASGSKEESVAIVSLSDSPLSTEDPAALIETRSAERRLAASSNEALVRVEDS
jgi:hypothetical protein